jgi:hypothetical protein
MCFPLTADPLSRDDDDCLDDDAGDVCLHDDDCLDDADDVCLHDEPDDDVCLDAATRHLP